MKKYLIILCFLWLLCAYVHWRYDDCARDYYFEEYDLHLRIRKIFTPNERWRLSFNPKDNVDIDYFDFNRNLSDIYQLYICFAPENKKQIYILEQYGPNECDTMTTNFNFIIGDYSKFYDKNCHVAPIVANFDTTIASSPHVSLKFTDFMTQLWITKNRGAGCQCDYEKVSPIVDHKD